MNKVTITIQGCSYNMVSEQDERRLLAIANYVDSEMDKVKRANPNLPNNRVSILAALNLADILFDCSEENENLLRDIENLKAELEIPNAEAQTKIAELDADLKAKEEYISNSKVEIDRLNEVITTQNETIDSLNNAAEGMKSEIESYKSEIEALKEEIVNLEKKAMEYKGIVSDWENKTCGLQVKITELENILKGTNTDK